MKTALGFGLGFCLLLACGDDEAPTDTGAPGDAGASDSTPGDAGDEADTGADSGALLGSVTFGITAETGAGQVDLAGATVWLRLPDGTLAEETSGADGAVLFEGVDLDAGGLEVTAWKAGHVALSIVGFDRGVIAYHEARGWGASAALG